MTTAVVPETADAPTGDPASSEPGRARVARFRLVAAIAVAGVVATVAWAGLRTSDQGTVVAVRALITQDPRFTNGPTSAATFATISQRLLDDGKACSRRRGSDDPRCAARLSAAAYASVTAVALLGCTQPGVYQARRGLYDELTAITVLDARPAGTVAPPEPPTVPTC